MARHVVKVDGLRPVLDHWIVEISKECGEPSEKVEYGTVFVRWSNSYQPPPRSGEDAPELREPPFICYRKGMLESLEGPRWDRIKWYYYCDDFWGNTIRLYDEEHHTMANNGHLYVERQNSFGFLGKREDRVLIRSENIGRRDEPLKSRMNAPFERFCWPSKSAPASETSLTPKCDVERLCEQFLPRRLAYFQNPQRNNMPGYEAFKSCDIDLCFPEPVLPDDPTPREEQAFNNLQKEIKSRRANFYRCTRSGVI